jgi:predicted transcriptional regulator
MKTIGIRVEPETKKRLEKLAKADDRTLSNFCRRILLEYLHQLDKHKKGLRKK